MVQIKSVSKHANFYPMLSEEALAELAADIKENGQQSPITVTADGVLLDGRNRLKACEIAGVEPRVTIHEGDDEGAFVRSSNERRHQPTGSRAMSTALSLQADNKRKNGRWERGSIHGDNTEIRVSADGRTWTDAMRQSGVILDELPELAQSVIDGEVALDDAYRRADTKRKARQAEEQRRIDEDRDEQAREDKAGRYFDNHPEAKAWLDSKPQGAFETMRGAYAAYMEHDREARRIEAEKRKEEEKRQRELDERYGRTADRLRDFINGHHAAVNLKTNPDRKQILAKLTDYERNIFLEIEESLHA